MDYAKSSVVFVRMGALTFNLFSKHLPIAGNYSWYCSGVFQLCVSCMLCIYYGFFFVCVWSYIFSVMCHVCRISAVHSCVMFSVSCLFCSVCVCVPVLVQKLLGPLCVLISQDQLLSRQDSFENLLSKKTKMNQRQISHLIRNGPSPTCKLKRYFEALVVGFCSLSRWQTVRIEALGKQGRRFLQLLSVMWLFSAVTPDR